MVQTILADFQAKDFRGCILNATAKRESALTPTVFGASLGAVPRWQYMLRPAWDMRPKELWSGMANQIRFQSTISLGPCRGDPTTGFSESQWLNFGKRVELTTSELSHNQKDLLLDRDLKCLNHKSSRLYCAFEASIT